MVTPEDTVKLSTDGEGHGQVNHSGNEMQRELQSYL